MQVFVAFIQMLAATSQTLGNPAHAASGAGFEKGYLLRTELNYQKADKVFHSDLKQIVAPDMKGWLTLAPSKEGVMLLGRVIKTEGQTIQMEYLVVDGSKQPNSVISAPSITTQLGLPAKVSMEDDEIGEKISVTLTATGVDSKHGG